MNNPVNTSVNSDGLGWHDLSPNDKSWYGNLGDFDFSNPESLRLFLQQSDPYVGQYKQSSSILPWKRDAEQNNSAMEFAQQSQMYQADIAKYLFELQYNSESSKVQRMRAAGLNPDLVGLDSASEASGNSFAQPVNESQMNDPAQELQQVSSLCVSVIGGVVNFGKAFQSMKASSLALDSAEMSLNDDIMAFARKYLSSNKWFNEWLNSPMSDPKSAEYSPFLIASNKAGSRYSKLIEQDITSMFGSRNGKRFSRAVTEMSESLQTRNDAQAIYNEYISRRGQYEGLGDTQEQVIHVIGVMNKALYDAKKAVAGGQQSQGEYNETFFDTLNPEIQAGSQNDLATASSQSAQKTTALDGPMAKVATSLWEDYNADPKKNWGSLIALVILNFGSIALGRFGGSYSPNNNTSITF